VARVVAVTPDLLLGSKVEALLRGAGHEVTLSASLPGSDAEKVDLLVADLDTEDAEALVEVETRRAAEAAGVLVIVPRSRMVRELPELVESVLSREA
jgi:hypothetical protein